MPQDTRNCNLDLQLLAKSSRRIVLPVEQSKYKGIVSDHICFRQWIADMNATYPELFPEDFQQGYYLHDIRQSRKMPDVPIRRIQSKQNRMV